MDSSPIAFPGAGATSLLPLGAEVDDIPERPGIIREKVLVSGGERALLPSTDIWTDSLLFGVDRGDQCPVLQRPVPLPLSPQLLMAYNQQCPAGT